MSTGLSTSGSLTGNALEGTTIQKRGNIATLKTQSSNLVALDTYGNEFKAPDYSIKDILLAIPTHCYERRLTTSFYYVFRDILLLVTVGYIGNTFIPLLPSVYLRFAAWGVYTYIQGLILTGIWVLAHECGHQAFSDYGLVNDTVGWILHSYLLVPYFSWKYSHGKHHKATGHITRDMVFVPKTKEKFLKARHASRLEEIAGDAPLYTLMDLLTQQLGGWIMYLWTNVTAGQGYGFWSHSHFNPTAPIFETRDYWYIVLSDLGIAIQLFVLYNWYQYFGGFNLFVNWFLPYIFTNHWLVFITFLQHTGPEMAHYDAKEWNFARGAAATIDREFGFVGEYLFHDIIETHVLHHYCSRIPFYNAREASEAIKKVMGTHYMHSDENMWVSLWKSGRWCQYVDGDNGLLMYRNTNNLGMGTKNTKD
ncbi:uncharacterized protein KQ657_002663 [Scheffersomyces spartinae]|uniref:Fatty acid desaturase domain-containing protein n=1 Tax=Scheffersomyces spartinae TaxID=45513 RepID=A0A9P8AGL4_9ASCO|nr:uncharacterized protein KQ657_002663 [Scheffersomyces spartinae]KAG7191874.1 hypothetical protein KQ657_002663 [Scheffersomyces spartinae]